MRKATFTSQRFQIEFGITEENEDEVRAAQDDDVTSQVSPETQQPPETLFPVESMLIPKEEDPSSPSAAQVLLRVDRAQWEEINLSPKPAPLLVENGSATTPLRRQTLPDIDSITAPASQVTARRSSIASAAICSSIGPSLAGAFPGAPSNLLDAGLRRSVTFATLALEGEARYARCRRWSARLPFLRNFQHQSPEPKEEEQPDNEEDPKNHHHYHHHHHHHHVLPHLHVPTFMITGPSSGDGTGRKFSFGIRRHSQTRFTRGT